LTSIRNNVRVGSWSCKNRLKGFGATAQTGDVISGRDRGDQRLTPTMFMTREIVGQDR
jgi:hypothetical protein